MKKPITSLQNQRVKNAIKLRDRRSRDKQGRIIIDGAREIHRALASGVQVIELFVFAEQAARPESQQALSQATAQAVERIDVTAPVFQKLCFGQRSDGLVATAKTPQRNLADLTFTQPCLLAVLEGIEKPGNVGAVIRSADGAGLSAVILANGKTDLYNPNAIRASLGAIFALPVCCASSSEVKAWLQTQQVQIVAADAGGAVRFDQVDFTLPTAIVLGSEAGGLSDTWRGAGIGSVRLPMLGVCDSLNVSATAAVLFYEARRQRGIKC